MGGKRQDPIVFHSDEIEMCGLSGVLKLAPFEMRS